MAGSADIVALQTAINRYATVAGFAAIPLDGTLTQDVLAASLRALGWISAGSSITDENDFTVDVPDDEANRASALIVVTDLSALQNDPSNVTDFLNSVADQLGLNTAQGSSAGPATRASEEILNALPTRVQIPLTRFAPSLPLWAKIGGIVGVLATVTYVVTRHMRRGRQSSST